MPEQEIRAMIARLDAAESHDRQGNRTAIRWTMHFQRAVLTTVNNYGEHSHTVVIPRNISARGIGFLYGGYIHAGQPCNLTVRTTKGNARCLSGTIVRCIHVSGRVHEVGIRLSHAISPLHFMIQDHADRTELLENMDPQTITGRALILSEDDALLSTLKQTKLLIIPASNPDAIPQLLHNKPDAVIIDESMTRGKWESLVHALRSKPYTEPIILINSENSPEHFIRATNLGCSDLLHRPFRPEDVLRTLAQHLIAIENFHKFVQQEIDSALAESVLSELDHSQQRLQYHIETRDLAAVLQCISSIAELAEQIGSEALEAIVEQCNCLLNSEGFNGAKSALDALAHACREAGSQQPHADEPSG